MTNFQVENIIIVLSVHFSSLKFLSRDFPVILDIPCSHLYNYCHKTNFKILHFFEKGKRSVKNFQKIGPHSSDDKSFFL